MNIDTSNTQGKIEVMQAFQDGVVLESRFKSPKTKWEIIGRNPVWHWGVQTYRIKPETLDQAAKIYASTPKASLVNAAEYDFKSGAKWQKEQSVE